MCIYKKKINCPACKTQFETVKVKNSKLRVDSMDTDLFKRYKDIEEHPIKYEAVMCPNCGYSALERHFDIIGKRGIELVKENVTSKWRKQDYTGRRNKDQTISVYKFALYCAEIMKKSQVELGGLCLRLAWINRFYRDKAQEEKYLAMTARLYEKAYLEEDLLKEGTDEITITYLIGDINARLGNYAEAVKWLNQTLFDKNISENRTLEKLAREQIPNLKLEIKKNKADLENS